MQCHASPQNFTWPCLAGNSFNIVCPSVLAELGVTSTIEATVIDAPSSSQDLDVFCKEIGVSGRITDTDGRGTGDFSVRCVADDGVGNRVTCSTTVSVQGALGRALLHWDNESMVMQKSITAIMLSMIEHVYFCP